MSAPLQDDLIHSDPVNGKLYLILVIVLEPKRTYLAIGVTETIRSLKVKL